MLKHIIKAMRIYQWAKNFLLFLPVLMAHQVDNHQVLLKVSWAFLAFSLCASAVYILNDMLDIKSDKNHPTKKNRPFAAGALSVKTGIILTVILLVLSIITSLSTLSNSFLIVLVIYLFSTTIYTTLLKRMMLIDVIFLGCLYTLRIVAGSVASMIEVSSWLLVFSLFFFLSLAFMKRYADLIIMEKNQHNSIAGRGYSVNDLDLVQKSGITSGFVSILVLALYINSPNVVELYKTPNLIWLTLPVLLYWLMRMWMVTNRGDMTDDPIIFAAKDKISYISIALIGIIMFVAATIDEAIIDYLQIIQ